MVCVRACMKSFYTDTDIETYIDIYICIRHIAMNKTRSLSYSNGMDTWCQISLVDDTDEIEK